MVVGTPARRPRGIHWAIGARLAANLVWLDALENGCDTRGIGCFYRKRIRPVSCAVRREPYSGLRLAAALGRDFQPQSRVAHVRHRYVRRGAVVVRSGKNDLGKSAALDDVCVRVAVADGYFSERNKARNRAAIRAKSRAVHHFVVHYYLEIVAAVGRTQRAEYHLKD